MAARVVASIPKAVRIEAGVRAPRGGAFANLAFVEVDVAAPGHELAFSWDGAAGANSVAVTAASLMLRHAAVEETVGAQPVSDGVITIPEGKRVASLTLAMTIKDDLSKDVPPKDVPYVPSTTNPLVITVSPDGGPFGAPSYAVPDLPANGVFPPTMTGASFANGVLTLPNVAARKLRLSVGRSGFPNDGGTIPASITCTGARLVTWPRDLTLTDEEGTTLWELPGEMQPADVVSIDLRNAAETLLKKKIGNAPLGGTFRLQGKGKAGAAFQKPRGSVVRTFSGVVSTELEGDAVPLALAPPPITPAPSRAIADLTVTYRALRVLDTVSSPVPAQAGGIAGIVVGSEPVLRAFPSQALNGLTIARIGIIGRAPVDCELVAEFFDNSSGAPGAALAGAAAAVLTASGVVKTIWLDVPPHDTLDVPVVLSLRTNHGRFLWAVGPAPLVRVAVPDPDPAGRTVNLAGRAVLPVTATNEIHAPASSIDVAAFAGAPLIADSLLFVSFDVSDLRLEYDR
jgi:hypothetical protein